MRIWKSLNRLVVRGLARWLEDADAPEIRVAAAIRTLERGRAGVKAFAAAAIAAERRLHRETRKQEARVQLWRQRFVHANDVDEAEPVRRLLREHIEILAGLQIHYDAACQASASARIAVHAIAARLLEARQIQQLLADRKRQDLRALGSVNGALRQVEEDRGES